MEQDNLNPVDNSPVEPQKKQKVEMVTVEKAVMDTLLAKIDSFEAFVASQEKKDQPYSRLASSQQRKRVRVHTIGGKVVVAHGKTTERRDEENNMKLYMDVTTEDGAVHLVKVVDYIHESDETPWCEVLDTKKQVDVKSQGAVPATIIDFENWRSYASDKMVALEVVHYRFEYLVALPDGRTIWLKDSVVN